MTYKLIKRTFDIISSFTAIVITSPLWLLIFLGIALSSKGPMFYVSERIGKDGKPFQLYKFRSMHVYQPQEGADLKTEVGYIANEKRIFKFGGFLRKSKLDELPQLLNILLGHMSVVGPRPLPEKSAKKNYSGEIACALSVRPGLTGLDSLFDYAHGELFVKDNDEYIREVLPVRNELARTYVEKRSVGLDFYCIIRTVCLMYKIVVRKSKDIPYTKYESQAKENLSNGKTAIEERK